MIIIGSLWYDWNPNLQALSGTNQECGTLVWFLVYQFYFPGTCFGSWLAIFRFYWYNQEIQALNPGLTKKLLVYQELIGLTKKKVSAFIITRSYIQFYDRAHIFNKIIFCNIKKFLQSRISRSTAWILNINYQKPPPRKPKTSFWQN